MEIDLPNNRNQIAIVKPYFEMVRLRNLHSLFAEFDIDIKPIDQNVIKIETDNKVAEEYIKYSTNGIKDYVNKLNSYELMLTGISAYVTNNKFSAVDSKPICYQVALKQTIHNLINSNAIKKTVLQSTFHGKNYIISSNQDNLNFSNVDFDCCYLPYNSITTNRTMEIKGNYKLDIANSKIKIIIESKSKYFNSNTKRTIGLWFKKQDFSAITHLRFYEILLKIKSDYHYEGINMLGFIIYFENNIEDENYDDILINFEWAIRNLLSNTISSKIINESQAITSGDDSISTPSS